MTAMGCSVRSHLDTDLLARRALAEQEGWLGEIEGIDLTLTFLRQKREESQRLARIAPVNLAPGLIGGSTHRTRDRRGRPSPPS